MPRVYRRKQLDTALSEAGIVSLAGAYQWILKREKEGKLTCPTDPISGQRKFTHSQIEEIVQSFLPGGKGRYP